MHIFLTNTEGISRAQIPDKLRSRGRSQIGSASRKRARTPLSGLMGPARLGRRECSANSQTYRRASDWAQVPRTSPTNLGGSKSLAFIGRRSRAPMAFFRSVEGPIHTERKRGNSVPFHAPLQFNMFPKLRTISACAGFYMGTNWADPCSWTNQGNVLPQQTRSLPSGISAQSIRNTDNRA